MEDEIIALYANLAIFLSVKNLKNNLNDFKHRVALMISSVIEAN